jgi:hypothetical protein
VGCCYHNIKANFYSREFSFYIETTLREVRASLEAIDVAYRTTLWLFPEDAHDSLYQNKQKGISASTITVFVTKTHENDFHAVTLQTVDIYC